MKIREKRGVQYIFCKFTTPFLCCSNFQMDEKLASTYYAQQHLSKDYITMYLEIGLHNHFHLHLQADPSVYTDTNQESVHGFTNLDIQELRLLSGSNTKDEYMVVLLTICDCTICSNIHGHSDSGFILCKAFLPCTLSFKFPPLHWVHTSLLSFKHGYCHFWVISFPSN